MKLHAADSRSTRLHSRLRSAHGEAEYRAVDALIVAAADAFGATDILTTDPNDIRVLAGRRVNILAL